MANLGTFSLICWAFLACLDAQIQSPTPPIPVPPSKEGGADQTEKKRGHRVTNGWEVDIERFPWSVSILDKRGNHQCGGALIGKEWVLTAYHCLLHRFKEDLIVVLGRSRLSSNTGITRRILYHTSSSATRRLNQYIDAKGLSHNDIQLIRLSAPVRLNKQIKVIQMWPYKEAEYSYKDYAAYFASWGTLSSGLRSDKLRAGTTRLQAISECRRLFGILDFDLTNDHMCGKVNARGQDICYGDSGSPLSVKYSRDNKDYLIGISVGGYNCGVKGAPIIFTEVALFKDHILNIIKERESKS